MPQGRMLPTAAASRVTEEPAMQTAPRRVDGQEPHADLLEYRSDFPILQQKTFLNTCSLGALSQRSINNVQEFLQLWAEMGAAAWYNIWVGKLAELRGAYGRVINAPADRIA